LFLDDLLTLKLAALYCDQIIIPQQYQIAAHRDTPLKCVPEPGEEVEVMVQGTFRTFSPEIASVVTQLIEESIITILDEPQNIDPWESFNVFYEVCDDVIQKSIPKKGNGKLKIQFNPSLFTYAENLLNYSLLEQYFSFLATAALTSSLKCEVPILTDMQIVDDLLAYFMREDYLSRKLNVAKLKTNFLTHKVMSEFVPNIKNASIEDVLEARYQLRNELEAFRISMAKLSGTIRSNPWTPEIEHDVDKIIESQVRPNLSSLKRSLRQSNLILVKRLFRNFKNLRTYVPLTATALLHWEPAIAGLASIGIAGFEAIYDTLLERRKIRDASGLSFLLKVSRKF
jgi:hypothetical protein